MIDYRMMLRDASDPRIAEFQSKLTPGKEGMIGVRIPEIRRIAKLIARDDWRSYLEDRPECYEEEVLRGIVIATADMDVGERLDLTEDFLQYIDNWATCDTFCSSWKLKKCERERAWDYFSGLMKTGSEYRMRASVVMRMSHFLDDEHVDALLEDLMAYDHDGYYYRMGAAWAISFCFIRYPDRTWDALESGRLCDWTQNKSVQKIRESLRVSDEDKERVLSLRRRAP